MNANPSLLRGSKGAPLLPATFTPVCSVLGTGIFMSSKSLTGVESNQYNTIFSLCWDLNEVTVFSTPLITM